MNDELGYLFYICEKNVISIYKDLLYKYDLTFPQYLVINYLFDKKDVIAKEITDDLKIDKGTLSPIINKLEEKEIIERKRPVKDERTFKISLSKKGKLLKNKFKDIPNEIDNNVALSKKDIQALKELLNKLNKERK